MALNIIYTHLHFTFPKLFKQQNCECSLKDVGIYTLGTNLEKSCKSPEYTRNEMILTYILVLYSVGFLWYFVWCFLWKFSKNIRRHRNDEIFRMDLDCLLLLLCQHRVFLNAIYFRWIFLVFLYFLKWNCQKKMKCETFLKDFQLDIDFTGGDEEVFV